MQACNRKSLWGVESRPWLRSGRRQFWQAPVWKRRYFLGIVVVRDCFACCCVSWASGGTAIVFNILGIEGYL